jgi:putative ABC transport system permease protein
MRALLVVIALGFSMAIMISVPSGIVANQEAMQRITATFGNMVNMSNTLIEVSNSSGMPSGMPAGAAFFGFGRRGSFIDETVVDEISTIGGVKDVVPFLEVPSNVTTQQTISTPRGSFTVNRPLYTIEGVCLNSTFIEEYSILPTNITAGRNLQEGDSGKVLLSLNLSDYYDVGVNSSISIYGEPFKVVGIYEPALSQGFMTANEVYMNISDAQRITGNAGNVSSLDVYADNASDVSNIAEVIQTAYGLSATTSADLMQTYQTAVNNAESTLSQTQTVAFEEIIVAVAATSLIVLVMMLYSVRERTKEIGILKAIGFSNWSVMSQFVLEGVLISLMAGVVGLVIGIIGAPYISSLLLPSASHINLFSARPGGFGGQAIGFSAHATVGPDLTTLLLGFGAVVSLGAIGSLYPAWRASRTSPMEALRYE